jgi:hypothetical protein
MKMSIIIEGRTEKAFLPYLRNFLKNRLAGNMPRLDVFPYDGRIPKQDKLKRVVENLLIGRNPANHVIALTDVYTGTTPSDFKNAQDAKDKMRQWVEKSRDSTRMPLNTISRLGCCPTGRRFKDWRDTTKAPPLVILRP